LAVQINKRLHRFIYPTGLPSEIHFVFAKHDARVFALARVQTCEVAAIHCQHSAGKLRGAFKDFLVWHLLIGALIFVSGENTMP